MSMGENRIKSPDRSEAPARFVKAVHALREVPPDPPFEIGLSLFLKEKYSLGNLVELCSRFAAGDGAFDLLMRRAIWRAATRRFGNGVSIHSGAGFKHLETFEIGNGVFIGAQSFIQGRFDGTCVIGDNVWIGPQSYFDARDLVIEEYVGWGPGAKLLGSAHTGVPVTVPIVQTDLTIRRVTIGAWSDIGTNAVILPGVTIGKGSIIGAGAVVNKDVPPFAVVAGNPAKFLHWREGYENGKS
jgi:acetyltransferase-like isoleucine patch superfamily enzyme